MKRFSLLPSQWMRFSPAAVSSLGRPRWSSSSSGQKPDVSKKLEEEATTLNEELSKGTPLDQFKEAQDKRTAEEIRLSQEIGKEAFEENTQILKALAMRGLRAFLVCAVGLAAFTIAMKRKKIEKEAESKQVAADDDPTARYLEEMRGLGFDVDTLEEELEAERRAKAKK